MGVVVRQSIWNSLNSYVGVALGALNTLVFFPYVFLNERSFTGEINFIMAFATVASTLGHLGLPIAIGTYFPRFKEGSKAQGQLWSFSVLALSGLSLLAVLASVLYSSFINPHAANTVQVILICIGMLGFELFAALSQHYKAVIFPQFLKHVFRRLLITGALAASYFLDIESITFYYILSSGYLLQIVLVALYSRKFLPAWQWSFAELELKEILKYGGMVMLASGAMIMVSRIDMIMIRTLLTKDEVALYNIVLFIGMVVSVPAKALVVSLRPYLTRAWADGNVLELGKIYRKSALNQMISNSLLFLLVWNFLDIAWLILPETYQFAEGAWVVFAIGLGEIIQGATGINGIILTVADRQRFNFYSGLALLVVTVLTNFLFIPAFGLMGAAFASLLAMSLINIFKVAILGKELKLWPQSKELFQVMGGFVAALALLFWVQGLGLGLVAKMGVGFLVIIGVYGGLYRFTQVFHDFKSLR